MSVVVAYANSAAHDHIHRYVLHCFGVQSGLKFRGHEPVTVAWIDEAEKMDTEQCHVESHRDDDQTKDPGEKMLKPQSLSSF